MVLWCYDYFARRPGSKCLKMIVLVSAWSFEHEAANVVQVGLIHQNVVQFDLCEVTIPRMVLMNDPA